MLNCSFCNTEFKNPGARSAHERRCSMNPLRVVDTVVSCSFCDKKFKGIPGLRNHENHCKCNPDRKERKSVTTTLSSELLFCKFCKKEFTSNNRLIQHQVKCSQNPDKVFRDYKLQYQNLPQEIKDRMVWNKGETKNTHESVRKYADKLRGRSHTTSQETKLKLSTTRIQRILSGDITPTSANGKYTVSYIEYKDGTRKMLRSSYELIIAIFLDILDVPFTYETIRLPYIGEDGKQHVFLGDFEIGNVVLDIKGRVDDEKLKKETETFVEAGYDFRPVYEADVYRIKKLLSEMFDINELLSVAREKSKNRDYLVYKLHQ